MRCQIEKIIKRSGIAARYDRDRIGTAIFRAMVAVKQPDRDFSEQLALAAEKALVAGYGPNSTPTVEEIQDIVEKTLIEAGAHDVARAYTEHRRMRSMARAARARSFEATDNIPYKKIYEVLLWNIDHGCDSVQGMNSLIQAGRFTRLIRDSDRRFDAEIEACASAIVARRGKTRIIIVAGPSSSGKTTTTCKIAERLNRAGLRLKSLNLDNYFFDLETHPRDQFGDYNYEEPQSLDLPLINRHLSALVKGQPTKIPRYDFKTGKRTLDAEEMSLADNELLLIDSLHGLFNDLSSSVPPEQKFKIYIETLGQFRSEPGEFMRWADNRLMRRMIRDSLHRNLKPMETLNHWHYVRRSELKHIIPFISSADFLLNSALPYEIPVLKCKVFHYLPAAMRTLRKDPHRQDAYIRAKRLHDLLKPVAEVGDDSPVPPDSLLREFIGGSRYDV